MQINSWKFILNRPIVLRNRLDTCQFDLKSVKIRNPFLVLGLTFRSSCPNTELKKKKKRKKTTKQTGPEGLWEFCIPRLPSAWPVCIFDPGMEGPGFILWSTLTHK